jgi:hypothetical protein
MPILLLFSMMCIRPLWGQPTLTLSDLTWSIWLDPEAPWQDDELFLPPVDMAHVPVHTPTCGWQSLYGKSRHQTTLPATVEQHTWGENGNGFGIGGNYTGVSWFFTTFEASRDWAGKRVVLDFESVRVRAEVFVNEVLVGYDLIHGTPFRMDVSHAINFGKTNRLAVRITDPQGSLVWRDEETTRWGDYEIPFRYGFGGITGRVWLTVSDKTYIEDVFVKNRPEMTTMDLEVTLRNEERMPTHGTLTYKVVPVGGRRILAKGKEKITTLSNRQVLRKTLKCKRADLWSPASPNLYELTLAWKGENGTSHSLSRRFGFRWFEVRDVEGDRQFYLNDRRIVYRSAASWGHWPINGAYPTPELARRQIETAKSLGLNMLHFHRAIGQSLVLDAADELGLLLGEEPGTYPPDSESDFTRAFHREKLLRMVKRDRNHPSLIIYNMANHATQDPAEDVYRNMADAHKLDETRIFTFTRGVFSQGRNPNPPLEAAPVKLHMLPYDHKPYQQGWWDLHQPVGPGVYVDSLYQGSTDYAGYLNHPAEILIYGHNGGAGTPPRLQRIKEAVAKNETAGWDGEAYVAQCAAFDHFLTSKGFRDAFATTDALCLSLGAVGHYHQGRVIENLRIANLADGYVINGWEGSKIEHQAGVVDAFRYPKTTPEVLATYNQPLYVAIKCHHKVVAVDEEIGVDLHLVNEIDVKGELTLLLSAEDERGRYIEKNWSVTALGGATFGELLVRDVSIRTRTAGYTTLTAVLRKGKKDIATGRERIYAVAYDPNELKVPIAVLDPNNEMQALLRNAGITDFREYDRGRPEAVCLVVGGGPSAAPIQGRHGLGDSILDWVTDGLTLVVVKQADAWADFLARRDVVDYRGLSEMGLGDNGGNYFVRQHPLFTGLPVNTAFNWEYQCLAQHQGRRRFGLRLQGEQCVVGCYVDHPPEVLTAVGIIALGRGRILLSTLDLEAALKSNERSAILAKQILLNYLKYATDIE